MSRNGVWKEYKLTIILGPCQCSAFALNCSRSLLFFLLISNKRKRKKGPTWSSQLTSQANSSYTSWHISRKNKCQLCRLIWVEGRTQKKKNCEAILCKRMSYRLVEIFASCAWYLSAIRSFKGVISVLRSTLPIMSKQINELLKNCYRWSSMIQSLFFIKI